jgi:hypothetical protein
MLIVSVRVQTTLNPTDTTLPEDIGVEFGRGFQLDVKDWKEQLLWQKLVFLLKRRGDHFESVHGLQMTEGTNTLSRIQESIKMKPNKASESSVAPAPQIQR